MKHSSEWKRACKFTEEELGWLTVHRLVQESPEELVDSQGELVDSQEELVDSQEEYARRNPGDHGTIFCNDTSVLRCLLQSLLRIDSLSLSLPLTVSMSQTLSILRNDDTSLSADPPRVHRNGSPVLSSVPARPGEAASGEDRPVRTARRSEPDSPGVVRDPHFIQKVQSECKLARQRRGGERRQPGGLRALKRQVLNI